MIARLSACAVTLAAAALAGPNSFAGGDFNGDGREDLTVGVPQQAVNGVIATGIVHVVYAAPAGGLTATGTMDLVFADSGLASESNQSFGSAIESGDFDGDGFDDLAISAPNRTVDGVPGAGAVVVFFGSAQGLVKPGAQIWHQNVQGVKDKAEVNTTGQGLPDPERFGSALAAGDFDGDGRDDLAIGVNEKVGSAVGAGAVAVLYGSEDGLSADGDDLWHQNSSGLKGKAKEGDDFGAALAAADFDGDGRDDLAVLIPAEEGHFEGSVTSGAVAVLRGGKSGLSSSGDRLVQNAKLGLLPELYGDSPAPKGLAAGDFDGDGRADLVVNAPFAGGNGLLFVGAVAVIRGGPKLLDNSTALALDASSAGLSFPAQHPPNFGRSTAVADFNGDGRDDLAVGVPFGMVGNVKAGRAAVYFGTPSGIEANSIPQHLFQSTGGLGGTANNLDLLGLSLTALDVHGDGRAELAIGAPGEGEIGTAGAGAVLVLNGTPGGLSTGLAQWWWQDTASASNQIEALEHFGEFLGR